MQEALDIQVTGVVQGVGFRPFVYRLARTFLIKGWVLNGVDGVHIHAEGEEKHIDEFVMAISEEAPAAARVKKITMAEVPLEGFTDFEIRYSDDAETDKTTLVSPDLATCDDCVRELFDPANRRYRYPFINCTNCGPRFTIIRSLPYDRPATSMADFPMCRACATEYVDPADRRFHAQPNACFECGPHISWYVPPVGPSQAGFSEEAARAVAPEGDLHAAAAVRWGTTRDESDAIIVACIAKLRAGAIVAIKGLGGFHLACDATNPLALAELRRRKRRPGKAFACMVPSVEAARAYCHVSEEEAQQLQSPARPIVLLKKRADAVFAPGLADGLSEVGIMLPATPLQHLIMHDYPGLLVMTSGNVHDEPIQIDDACAYRALAGIADAFLGNDRAILSRYDDSVLRVLDFGERGTSVQMIRRARGFAPAVVPLTVPGAQSAPVIFATGPEQKNTFTLTRPGEAFVSQHIGDMENAPTNDAWLTAKSIYEKLFKLEPERVACDKHPEYLTSKWAHAQKLPVTEVQHHHAHLAAAMAENKLEGPVCGFAFDGTGYGEDGVIWGGEVMLANLSTFERFANFTYFPLPGGAAAIKHPLRCAWGLLWALDLLDHPQGKRLAGRLGEAAPVCQQMIDRGLNSPFTSSVGRLFDAASALLGICEEPTYEGEGAVLLEAAIDGDAAIDAEALDRYHVGIVKNVASKESTALDTSVLQLDPEPVFRALLDDVEAGVPTGAIARRFHEAFVRAIVEMAQIVEAVYGVRTVVLSGGVFMNRYLVEHAVPALADLGYTVAMNRDLPPNDACVSFGQAVVALNR